MSDLDQARLLLAQSQKDLTALENMLEPDKFDDSIFGFHVQQAVEKALKAWLAALDKEYPYRHDLGELQEALLQTGQDVAPFQNLISYTPFAVQFRYDEFELQGLPQARPEAVQDIQNLLKKVEEIISDL